MEAADKQESDLEVFHDDSDCIEIVYAVKKPNGKQVMVARRYPSVAKAAAKEPEGTTAVYHVVNPIDAVELKKHIDSDKGKRCCAQHIEHRRWLVLDFDPTRPSAVCSKDDEKSSALAVAKTVKSHLADVGFCNPTTVDNGNGFHMYYPIDLPNDHESKELIKRFLMALDGQFGTDQVKIDRTVYNAAQLMRLPGSINQKGTNTPERPHRPVMVLETSTQDRILPMAPECYEFLKQIPKHQRKGYVFNPIGQNQVYGRLTVQTIGRTICQIGESAGIKVDSRFVRDDQGQQVSIPIFASSHDLRRSFGERWAARIMPPQLMELMRHESIETTLRFYVGTNAAKTSGILYEAHRKAKAGLHSTDTFTDSDEKRTHPEVENALTRETN